MFNLLKKAELKVPKWIVDDHPDLNSLLIGMLERNPENRVYVGDLVAHEWLKGMFSEV